MAAAIVFGLSVGAIVWAVLTVIGHYAPKDAPYAPWSSDQSDPGD